MARAPVADRKGFRCSPRNGVAALGGNIMHEPRKMDRRSLLREASARAGLLTTAVGFASTGGLTAPGKRTTPEMDEAQARDWLTRWEANILKSAQTRYCDREMGEEIGWLVSPFLNGFYYGYLATRDARWVDMLVDWADALIQRAVKEPDGNLGWPKPAGASTSAMPDFVTDNMLGEAMGLRPIVLMADTIRKTPALREKYARKAEQYVALAEQVFEKWDARGCWRPVENGGVWVVPPFGLDAKTGGWTEDYDRRKTDGFSMPANKQNHIARWLVAMHDVTKKPVYRERAEQWWRQMKSRMKRREGGKYYVWNYWDPAGPWDHKPDGSPRHWIGVHPNGGYYGIDVEGIATAYEHRLVFTRAEIDRLIATNRDFMWNGQVSGAKFQRIDGEPPDPRWKDSPGVLWSALVPYDETLRKIFEANHNPDGWGGLAGTPRHLAREAGSIRSGLRGLALSTPGT
jgi:hypothetical protein